MVYNVKRARFWRVLSWEESTAILFKLQKRLFKTAYISDRKKSLALQKLILQSNCARLLAIREITQLSLDKKIPGVDGKLRIFNLHLFYYFNKNSNK